MVSADLFGLLLGLFVGIAVLALYLYLVIWVFRDAKRRGNEPLPWAVLVFFVPILGLILYLIFRNRRV